jgi:hypothetical protein
MAECLLIFFGLHVSGRRRGNQLWTWHDRSCGIPTIEAKLILRLNCEKNKCIFRGIIKAEWSVDTEWMKPPWSMDKMKQFSRSLDMVGPCK